MTSATEKYVTISSRGYRPTLIDSIFVSYVIVKVRCTSSGILESLSFLAFSFPDIVSDWILIATMCVRELTRSVVLSRPGTEVLAVQIFRFAEDGLWGKLFALGIMMIFISTGLVVIAALIGAKLATVQAEGQ